MEIHSPNGQEIHWIREICDRAWLLADMQLLLILKFNDVIYFLFDTVRLPVSHLSKNRTENRFHAPVHAVNRAPVHKTTIQLWSQSSSNLTLHLQNGMFGMILCMTL